MEIFTKAVDKMTRQMEKECIFMLTVQNTKDNEKMICRTDTEKNVEMMEALIKVITKKAKSMVLELISEMTGQLIADNGMITK